MLLPVISNLVLLARLFSVPICPFANNPNISSMGKSLLRITRKSRIKPSNGRSLIKLRKASAVWAFMLVSFSGSGAM